MKTINISESFIYELAKRYKDNPVFIAELCDELLDRSGGLLGEIRKISQRT